MLLLYSFYSKNGVFCSLGCRISLKMDPLKEENPVRTTRPSAYGVGPLVGFWTFKIFVPSSNTFLGISSKFSGELSDFSKGILGIGRDSPVKLFFFQNLINYSFYLKINYFTMIH